MQKVCCTPKFWQSTYLEPIQHHHPVDSWLWGDVPIKWKCVFLLFVSCQNPATPVTHTHTGAHMYTLCHTWCYCVTHSGCKADTCSDMMVSVEVVTLAVCCLPRWELVESGEERKETRNTTKPFECEGVDFVVTVGDTRWRGKKHRLMFVREQEKVTCQSFIEMVLANKKVCYMMYSNSHKWSAGLLRTSGTNKTKTLSNLEQETHH